MSAHPQFPAMSFRILHTTKALSVDAVILVLKVGGRQMSHVQLKLKGFLDQAVVLKVLEEELVVAVGNPRILACQTSGTGKRNVRRNDGAKDGSKSDVNPQRGVIG